MAQDNGALDDIYLTTLYAFDITRGKTRQDFYRDMQMQAALRHKLIVIGEAVKRLSSSFLESKQEIPWSKITGMRDRLAHEYDTVDLAIIWDTVEQDLPVLREYLEPICSNRPTNPKGWLE